MIYENLDINNLENEIWKVVEGYEDYAVSNLGRIKSFKKWHGINERILKQCKDSDDYFIVDLYKNKKGKSKRVHRLVHEAHKEKLEEGYNAHHINEDREDNNFENLKSVSESEHQNLHHIGKYRSEETKNKMSENHADFKGKKHPLFGKHHSKETKLKMSEKQKGEKSHNHKLTEEQVIQIKLLLREGILTQKEIAYMFDVSRTTISDIKTGKMWNHVII